MNKLCLVFLGALLFALHLASQVQAAQNTTMTPSNTSEVTMNTSMGYSNMTTGNSTQDKSAGKRTEVSLLLLSLALGFLHGWS